MFIYAINVWNQEIQFINHNSTNKLGTSGNQVIKLGKTYQTSTLHAHLHLQHSTSSTDNRPSNVWHWPPLLSHTM